MKILHATKKYPNAYGGDAFVVSNIEKIQSKENEVFILTSNCNEIKNKKNIFKFGLNDTSKNLDKITIKRMISLMILFISSFSLIKKIKPDVVHYHSPDIGFILSFASRIYRIPMILTCHGVSFPYKRFNKIKKYLELFCLKYSGFEQIITVDYSTINAFKNNGIDNVIYIPNGVDIKRFGKVKRTIKEDKVIQFLFVGRLEEQKGVKYLIEATALLRKKIKKFRVSIVGDGSLRRELETLVEEKSISDIVTFHGKLSETKLLQLYKNSDVFVLPSLWEGFPLTILEAWSSKLGLITTNTGSIPFICSNMEDSIIMKKFV